MADPYYTVTANSEFTITIKKSRFICHLFRIKNEEQAKAMIAQTKLSQPKANHNCFAYMLGESDQIQRMSDDGEPSGTAGEPILTALQQTQIHDVLAIVTRYFGGIKLGASGLIRAYNGTTAQAIQSIGRVQRIRQTILAFNLAYSQVDLVNYFLAEQDITPQSVTYLTDVQYQVPVETVQIASFQQSLNNLLNSQVAIAEQGEQFNEVPVKD